MPWSAVCCGVLRFVNVGLGEVQRVGENADGMDLNFVFGLFINQSAEPDDLLDGTIVTGVERLSQSQALLRVQALDAFRTEQFKTEFILMLPHFLHRDGEERDGTAARLDIFFFRDAQEEVETLAGLENPFNDFIGNIFARKDETVDHPHFRRCVFSRS